MKQLMKRWIAEKVREKAEVYVKKMPKTDDIDDSNLAGLCAIASFALKKELEKNGYEAQLIRGGFQDAWGGHCWVECEGEIIDITATQFQIAEKVLIVPADDPRYEDKVIVKTRNSFRNWPLVQKPLDTHVSKLLAC